MQYKKYPIVISFKNGEYIATCPDIGFRFTKSEYDIEEIINAVNVHCLKFKENGKPLPPATSISDATSVSKDTVSVCQVIVVQSDEAEEGGDN